MRSLCQWPQPLLAGLVLSLGTRGSPDPITSQSSLNDPDSADTVESDGGEVTIQRGDLVVWGRPFVYAGEDGHDEQLLHMFSEYAAEFGGVLAPFWGDVDSWNGTPTRSGYDGFWTQMTVVEEDGLLQEIEGVEATVLRPTEAWAAELDLDAMIERANQPIERYNLPVVPFAIRWWNTEDNPCAWLWLHEGYETWSQLFGIDLLAMTELETMQYSPSLGSVEATDIASEAFWDRDQSEGSHAAWAIHWGWYLGGYPELRDELLDSPEAIAAIDSISVGQLAWWLVQAGLVEPVGWQPTATMEILYDLWPDPREWVAGTATRLPAEPSLLVSTDGLDGAGTLVLDCDNEAQPVTIEVEDLSEATELPQACSYPDAGRYRPSVQVVQNEEVVATARLVTSVIPESLELERGDIVVFGQPSLEEGDFTYPIELYEGFFGRIAADVGIYDPFFGYPLETLDGTTIPLGDRYQWGHIEMLTKAGDYPLCEDTLVLRPTEAMHALVDVRAMADREEDPLCRYTRPYMGALVHWVHWGRGEIDWMGEHSALFERWEEAYGLDFDSIPVPQVMTSGPTWGSDDHTDITADSFWERDRNCSTRLMWEFVWGAYIKRGESVREAMLGNWEVAAAIDNVTPGQAAWWLLHEGLVEIVYVASDPGLEHVVYPE